MRRGCVGDKSSKDRRGLPEFGNFSPYTPSGFSLFILYVFVILNQGYDVITGLQDHVIVRCSYHDPCQLHLLVLVITVSVHQPGDGQTQTARVPQGCGVQGGELCSILGVPEIP